jgi:hypothetical protein
MTVSCTARALHMPHRGRPHKHGNVPIVLQVSCVQLRQVQLHSYTAIISGALSLPECLHCCMNFITSQGRVKSLLISLAAAADVVGTCVLRLTPGVTTACCTTSLPTRAVQQMRLPLVMRPQTAQLVQKTVMAHPLARMERTSQCRSHRMCW